MEREIEIRLNGVERKEREMEGSRNVGKEKEKMRRIRVQ